MKDFQICNLNLYLFRTTVLFVYIILLSHIMHSGLAVCTTFVYHFCTSLQLPHRVLFFLIMTNTVIINQSRFLSEIYFLLSLIRALPGNSFHYFFLIYEFYEFCLLLCWRHSLKHRHNSSFLTLPS